MAPANKTQRSPLNGAAMVPLCETVEASVEVLTIS